MQVYNMRVKPEESVLFINVVESGGQLHFRKVLEIALDGAQTHGGDDEKHRQHHL